MSFVYRVGDPSDYVCGPLLAQGAAVMSPPGGETALDYVVGQKPVGAVLLSQVELDPIEKLLPSRLKRYRATLTVQSRQKTSRDISKGHFMPAHPRIPDPEAGPLQAFAVALRELGQGGAPVPLIAEESGVSRAALYAAMSGNRLPDEETVATLLRWWVGDPSAELDGPRYEAYSAWWWVRMLPEDHPGRVRAAEWRKRYSGVRKRVLAERSRKTPATPVSVPVPFEQKRFMAALAAVVRETGLEESLWLLFAEPAARRRLERYLAGTQLPTYGNLRATVLPCLHIIGVQGQDLSRRVEEFEHLVDDARAGRRRDRRLARKQRASAIGVPGSDQVEAPQEQ